LIHSKIAWWITLCAIIFGSLWVISCEDLQTLLQKELDNEEDDERLTFYLEGPQTVSSSSSSAILYRVWGDIFSDTAMQNLRVDRVSWELRDSNRQIPEGRYGEAAYEALQSGGQYKFYVNYKGLPPGLYTLEVIIFLKDGTSEEKVLPITVQ